jgi:uncharacterized protein YndB with AHSA1/START domain
MTEMIQPVVVAIDVRRGIEEAFRVFTAEIGAWWPVAGHSVEPDRVETVVLEGRVGGRLYERWHDGGEVDWGRVLAWEPPARLVLSWSPTLERRPPTEVEVRFLAVEPDHTRVELEHRGWERLGDLAAQARSSYEGGWPGVLDAFAGTAMAVHHRAFARSLNGQVWRLLARSGRTGDDDARMVDTAYAAEAMARALACAGDLDQAAGWHSRATAAGATVTDDEDRKIFTEDLATGPWFGLGLA